MIALGALLLLLAWAPLAQAQVGSLNAWIQDRVTGERATVSVTPPGGAGTGLYVHCISGCSGSGGGGTSSNYGAAFPAAGTAAGFFDGTNMQGARVFDVDSSGSFEYVLGVNLRLTSGIGSVEFGTNTNPIRVDPTGTTTQPVNCVAGCAGSGGTSSTYGAAFPATGTAAGFFDGTNMQGASVFDADSGGGFQYVLGVNLRLSSGGGSVELGTGSNPIRVDPTGTTPQSVTQSGTWNIGTLTTVTNPVQVIGDVAHDAPAGAVDPVLTGCYASAAAPADVSADADATREWCLRNGARAIQPTFAGILASTGTGASGTGTQRVVLSSDSALAANQSTNVAQFGGTNISTGTGAAGAGIPRVTVSNDSAVRIRDNAGNEIPSATTQPLDADRGLTVRQPISCPDSIAISQTADTQVITGTSGQRIYICSIMLMANAAETVNIIEGTGSVCATSPTAVYGSTTEGNGMAFVAGGGFAQTAAQPFRRTAVDGNNLCITQVGSSRVTGSISYRVAPND